MRQLQQLVLILSPILAITLGCDSKQGVDGSKITSSHHNAPTEVTTFQTESGLIFDDPFYEVDADETLVAKVVLKAGESQHFTIVTTEPLSVGFKVPFGLKEVDQLKFRIDDNHQFPGMKPMKLAARLQETEAAPGTTPNAMESQFGGSLTLPPKNGAISIDLISKMDEPMEFLVYTEKPDDE